jgi:alkanesulfonate monooxygenase SsuD/methylene tetrahydromethanopterin reductase-like flavin-dependent oxidoreductase (luciferase family)
MKVSALAQAAYRNLPDDFETRFDAGVTTPWHLTEPGEVHAAFRDYLDCLMLAARLGFDGVGFTEHGQSSYDMVANPSLVGAAIAYATEAENLKVAINPVGISLGKAREPVRVAEEYAMIDCISGGRLIAGFPVGLLYDASINNGVPPIEVRARFDENLPLVLRAWRDKAPFA